MALTLMDWEPCGQLHAIVGAARHHLFGFFLPLQRKEKQINTLREEGYFRSLPFGPRRHEIWGASLIRELDALIKIVSKAIYLSQDLECLEGKVQNLGFPDICWGMTPDCL